MRLAEEMLARELADGPDRLVVVDGPLTFEEKNQLKVETTMQRRGLLAQSLDETRSKLAECDRQIEAVGAANPEAEADRLEKSIRAVEKKRTEALEAFDRVQGRHHEAELTARGAEGEKAIALREYESAAQAANAAVQKAGFASREAVHKAVRTLAEISAADAQLREPATFAKRAAGT